MGLAAAAAFAVIDDTGLPPALRYAAILVFSMVGGLIPAAGSVDAALRVAQGKGDLHTALKQLPGSNLPWIAPILNLAKED